jgi:NADP-dependent 3-hydroxy acid dehydrogenase YdfG
MSDRVIVITGASSGIGEALARRLGAQGQALVLAARDDAKLRAVADACGPRSAVVVTDVTNRAEMDRLRVEALAAFGRIDVWVNNVGRGINRSVLELTDADIDEMVLVNTKSALYGMQAIVPYFMSRKKGHLINVSTVLSRVSSATFRSAYSASKAALNVLTANLRVDLRSEYPDIHISLVFPGGVPTAFQKSSLGGTPEYNPPLKGARVQTAAEVAELIAGVIDSPAADVYSSPILRELVQQYYEDADAFDRAMAGTPTSA